MTILHTSTQGIICKYSTKSVADTCNKLIILLEKKEFKIFADIDHRAGAACIDLDLPDTRTIIF